VTTPLKIIKIEEKIICDFGGETETAVVIFSLRLRCGCGFIIFACDNRGIKKLHRAGLLHIISRARAANFAGFKIKNLSKLSLETALKLFHFKVAPMATYGIQIAWMHLSVNNLLYLEKVKTG
jgi:hypothetical protein